MAIITIGSPKDRRAMFLKLLSCEFGQQDVGHTLASSERKEVIAQR